MRVQMLILWFKGLKSVANRVNVKKKFAWLKGWPAYSRRFTLLWRYRVTLLADPTFLHTNTLAPPAGSTWSRRDNQSTCEHCWLGQRGQLFFRWPSWRVTVFFGTTFLHMNGTQMDEIKLQYSVWFESIKRLVLVSAVKEYFCVHILKFYIVLSLRLNRRD